MDVRMMLQGLAPGVENHGHAELGAEMPGVGRDGGERLRGRAEQDRIDRGLVLEGDVADRRRQREDDMEVRHRQQLSLPLREPLGPRQPLAFGTVTVAAGVVSDARCATIIALLDMAAERGRPAGRDGAHDATPACACRNASPLRRKMSATSSTGAMAPAQRGGTTSKRSRSSGLGVLLIVLVATRV